MTDEAKAMGDVERVADKLLAALVEAADEIHHLRRHANRTGGMYEEEDPAHLRDIIETATAAIKAMSGWRDIETAPRGPVASRGSGPKILGLAIGHGWHAHNIVWWEYHKNPARGSWKSVSGCWEPDFWMPLPTPPEGGE